MIEILEVEFVQFEDSVGSAKCVAPGAETSHAAQVGARAKMTFDPATRLLTVEPQGKRTALIPAERIARMYISPRPAKGEKAPPVPVETSPVTDGKGNVTKHKVAAKG